MILGAVLAGGRSTRFGSDKALAEIAGRTLLSRAVEALSAWCDHVAVVGRETAPAPTLPDWPAPGAGPLGGVAAALNHALDTGYESVLTCGVDSIALPEDLLERLSPAPRYVATQPVIGHWPSKAAGALEELMFSSRRHSMLAFAELIGARPVKLARDPANINTPADLKAAQERSHGL